MRRDVRMGFGVGGVLLAVIIVAVLVVHRNQNKQVVFDTNGKPAASTSDPALDATGPETPKPVEPSTPSAVDAVRVSDHKEPPAATPTDKWDALFASTTAEPVRSQLGKSSASRQKPAIADRAETSQEKAPAELAQSTPPRDTRASNSARTHTVQAGETLSAIAMTVYGDSRQYKTILTANPGVDPAKLRPGMVLQIPPLTKAKESPKSSGGDTTSRGTASPSDGKTYVVQKDDSLYRITRKLYGSGERQDELYNLNKQLIGNDSTKLKPGMVLKLPAPPTQR